MVEMKDITKEEHLRILEILRLWSDVFRGDYYGEDPFDVIITKKKELIEKAIGKRYLLYPDLSLEKEELEKSLEVIKQIMVHGFEPRQIF